MVKFLDDCLGSCIRAIATSSAILSLLRWSLILIQLFWPSQGSRECVEELSLIVSDLFYSKFNKVLL